MTGDAEPAASGAADVRFPAHMADTTLGEVVRTARVNAGISLRQLAIRLGVTPSYVSDIENDRRVPSEDVLGRIAQELNLDRADLLARAGRLQADADRYMRGTPAATTLFRRITEERFDEAKIRKVMERVDELSREDDEPGGGQ